VLDNTQWYVYDLKQLASPNDLLEILIGPITRFETKRIQDELIVLILDIWVNRL
jgi:hypothetical protein